jgi:hypothetical protein
MPRVSSMSSLDSVTKPYGQPQANGKKIERVFYTPAAAKSRSVEAEDAIDILRTSNSEAMLQCGECSKPLGNGAGGGENHTESRTFYVAVKYVVCQPLFFPILSYPIPLLMFFLCFFLLHL